MPALRLKRELIGTLTFLAPAAVLSGWATVLLQTVSSGRLHTLLSPLFRGNVMAASLVLYGLSLGYLLGFQPALSETPSISFRSLGRWLVLLLPLLLAAGFSSTSLSPVSEENRAPTSADAMPTLGQESQENVQAALTSDPNQPVPLEVTDLITISRSAEQRQAFTGRKVRVVGLYNPEGARLVRWIMWCCAADAVPTSLYLSGQTQGAAAVPDKQNPWVEVVGTVSFPATLGHPVPQIEANTVQPTKEPDEPYLSP